jgi:hypothetical protein
LALKPTPVTAFLIGGALIVAVLLTFVALGSAKEEEWTTYRNPMFDYEIDYPADWELTTQDPRREDAIKVQLAQLSNGKDSVLVTVNMPAPICGEAVRLGVKPVEVEGAKGRQFECPTGPTTANQIVRDFGEVAASTRVTVLGQPGGSVGTVRRIVESFRFAD